MRDRSGADLVRSLLYPTAMRAPSVPSVIIESLSRRQDRTDVIHRPRSWPRATQQVINPVGDDKLRATIWFAIAGLMTAIAIYLVS